MDVILPGAERKRRSGSLARDLSDRLLESIKNGTFRPGDKLPTESEIIRQQGVSRTVVREALSSLQAYGVVETRQGIGTFVRSSPNPFDFMADPETMTTMRDVLAMMELRISLETEAAGLAAARRTEEQLAEMHRALDAFQECMDGSDDGATPDFQFHFQVASATGNHYFAEVMSHLGTATIPRTRVNSFRIEGSRCEYLKHVHQQHHEIYNAIRRRDPETARATMRAHLNRSYERLRRVHDAAERADPATKPGLP